jgi:hypothetical protein
MGFDRSARQATSAQHRIGALQGALFHHLTCGNPSGFVRSEARFFSAPELN